MSASIGWATFATTWSWQLPDIIRASEAASRPAEKRNTCYICLGKGRAQPWDLTLDSELVDHIAQYHEEDEYFRHTLADSAGSEQDLATGESPICPANEWVLHVGDIHYARNKSDFVLYRPVKEVGFAKNGANQCQILGIGTVRLRVRQTASTLGNDFFTLLDVHHIPTAPCNGISLQRLRMGGKNIRNTPEATFEMSNIATSQTIGCGSTSSERFTVSSAGCDPRVKREQHFTKAAKLDLNVYHGDRPQLESYVERPDRNAKLEDMHSENSSRAAFAAQAGLDRDKDNFIYDAMKNDPERLKRKASEKVERLHHQKSLKRQRLERVGGEEASSSEATIAQLRDTVASLWHEVVEHKMRLVKHWEESAATINRLQETLNHAMNPPPQPISNEWILHMGNISYCRDQSMFTTLEYIDTTAIGGDGESVLQVCGVGKVTFNAKSDYDKPASPFTYGPVLWIPDATCNGLTTDDFDKRGWKLQVDHSNCMMVVDSKTGAVVLCANDFGGLLAVCLDEDGDGDGDGDEAPLHVNWDQYLDHTAGW